MTEQLPVPAERDASGRFLPGNPGGPGNPHATQVSRLRSAMLRCVTEDEIREVVGKLIELAKRGNVPAAREILDRCLGRAADAADFMERLERLETVLAAAALRRSR